MTIARAISYGWNVLFTQFLWRWRLGHLGERCVLKRSRCVVNPNAISIGHHTLIESDWFLADLSERQSKSSRIDIGCWCRILHDFQCNAQISVTIGDHVLIGPRVFISDCDHVIPLDGRHTSTCGILRAKPVIIEHDVWIGVNAVILKGVTIGHHSIVAAGAVVTRSCAPFSIMAGVPAKVVGNVADVK